MHLPLAEELRDALITSGNRLTTPRRAVWQVLTSTEEHLTADEIGERVRRTDPDINLSSVYRTLTLFAELGLVRESKLDSGGPAHWELAHPDDQFHLKCRSCNRVEHHTGDLVHQVRVHLEEDHSWTADKVELVVTGLCPDCLAE